MHRLEEINVNWAVAKSTQPHFSAINLKIFSNDGFLNGIDNKCTFWRIKYNGIFHLNCTKCTHMFLMHWKWFRYLNSSVAEFFFMLAVVPTHKQNQIKTVKKCMIDIEAQSFFSGPQKLHSVENSRRIAKMAIHCDLILHSFLLLCSQIIIWT